MAKAALKNLLSRVCELVEHRMGRRRYHVRRRITAPRAKVVTPKVTPGTSLPGNLTGQVKRISSLRPLRPRNAKVK